ncbi:MAG: hypothetical protein ACREON_13235, partial [Gemmatimonadaceae bacterium]
HMALPVRWLAVLLCACSFLPFDAPAQGRDTSRTPSVSLSGVLFANFQYRTDDAARDANRFDLERIYLTARTPLGDRASLRFTTDVFQQTGAGDSYYRGWTIRAKYAYLQYDFLRSAGRTTALARLGMLHTVVIEHIESFWPRWISTVPVDRYGYFSSADLGVAAEVKLPGSMGEVYATVTNGPGYTSRETDRFKDFAARLSLTPLASTPAGFMRSLTLTAWGYRGALASRFVDGGSGQIGPVSSSLRRDRWGVFAGVRDPRVTVGAEYSVRRDEGELGQNTPAAPRLVNDSTGTVTSAFAVVRPFRLVDASSTVPLSLVARWDRLEPNDDRDAAARLLIAGVVWDLTSRLSLSLDYQGLSARGASVPETTTMFLHAYAAF